MKMVEQIKTARCTASRETMMMKTLEFMVMTTTMMITEMVDKEQDFADKCNDYFEMDKIINFKNIL